MSAPIPIKEYLLIPGPTQLPPEVIQAMAYPMINHRGPRFAKLLDNVFAGLKWAYQTKNDVVIIPSSGTGAMEAAVVNVLSKGDKVLVLNIGNFGARFVKIAKAYGLDVEDMFFERGKAADPKMVEERLKKDKNKEIKAVLFQQNETSTGVINDVKSIAKIVKEHGALIIVDAVSGLLTADLKVDEWGLDVVAAGAQKAFMVPPGVAFVAISKKAWDAHKTSNLPKFYWDFSIFKDFLAKGQTPTTPPISVLFGLEKGLELLQKEGLENIFDRHAKLCKAVWVGGKALGLKFLADEKDASKAVTAVRSPEGVDAEQVRKICREKYGVILAPGQGELKGKIFRIGHIGYAVDMDVLIAFSAVERAFKELGAKIEVGKGVAAIQKYLAS
ncbi:pyridoxal-phosphate-dependent aminotransferase family protein [Candidatus Margulisiibacteriota bacterium]